MNAAARRETILDAATTAFTAAGYDRTRVSDIAASVGVTDPVVFQNFGTKAGLFAAVLDRVSEGAAGQLAAMGGHREDALELLARMLAADVQDRAHASGGEGVLYAEADARPEDVVADARRRSLGRLAEAMAAIFRRGQAERSIRNDIDANTLAWLALSLIRAHEFRRQNVSAPSRVLEDDLLAAVLAVLRPPG
jgi:AcrR family transcriptional regulator